MGYRTIDTASTFFIPRHDALKMNTGDVFRLKGLYNVKINKTGDTVQGTYDGEELISENFEDSMDHR